MILDIEIKSQREHLVTSLCDLKCQRCDCQDFKYSTLAFTLSIESPHAVLEVWPYIGCRSFSFFEELV